jgi:predicted nucleotidyltransferase
MQTPPIQETLGQVLFGKTRRKVLGLLLSHPGQTFYLREIVRWADVGLGAVQRELKTLVQVGVIRRSVRGTHVFFQADPDCPVFADLRGIVLKTTGLADVLCQALAPLRSQIRFAFIYGSMARGQDRASSDVDLMVVGDVSFDEVVDVIAAAEESLRREVNPTVYPLREFKQKLSARHYFVSDVVRNPTIFLVGNERDLAGLVAECLAAPSRGQSERGARTLAGRRPRPAERGGAPSER